ncbi:MAG: transposase, partial [Gammaproteobacteria bacterium]
MKKSKFSEAQISFALKQAETGTKVEEVCRKMGSAKRHFI